VPWLRILTSPPVWSIVFPHICCSWGEYTFVTNSPTYMKEVLKFDIKTKTREEWQTVFYITAAIYVTGAIVFVIFGSGDQQDWDPKDRDKDTNLPTNPEGETTPLLFSSRMSLAIMAFLGFCNLYMLRVNMSVAIVCMVNQTALRGNVSTESTDKSDNNRTGLDETSCVAELSHDNQESEDGEFLWDKRTQGVILGSFYWGYICTQIAGGWLSTRFGGKRVFGWFMFVCALATIFTPLAARAHVYFLITLRFLAGFCQGVVWPAQQSLWASWAPPLESSRLGGFGYAGSQIGNVITFPLAALLCKYGFDGGWSSIFYIFGGIGILWFIAWMILVYDSPNQHPRISEAERDYIVQSLEGKLADKNKQTQSEWQTVFYIAAAMYTVGAVFYLVFGSGEVQSWAVDDLNRTDIILEKKECTYHDDVQKENDKDVLNEQMPIEND
ncbi:hypothetical protein FSP39_021470, partial [Pinctada imbricata]